MNPLSPDRMTPADRRSALCALLAAGLLRLRARVAEPFVPSASDDGAAAMFLAPGRQVPFTRKDPSPANRPDERTATTHSAQSMPT